MRQRRWSSAEAVLDASIGRSPASASPESISPTFHFSTASGAGWLLGSRPHRPDASRPHPLRNRAIG